MPRDLVIRRRSSGRSRGSLLDDGRRRRGTLWVVGVVALLGLVNLYIFGLRKNSVGDLMRAAKEAPPPMPPKPRAAVVKPKADAPAARTAAAGAEPDVEIPEDGRVAEGKVGDKDTLAGVLRREGVPQKTANEVAAALGKVLDLRTIRAGHAYTLRSDSDDRLRTLEYRVSPATFYRVERRGDGWKATKVSAPLDTQVIDIGGVVETSLYEAVKRTGESPSLVSSLVDIFAWDLNFYVDTHPGDAFRLVVEKHLLDGKFYKFGKVLAAEYSTKSATYRAFWYEPADRRFDAGYYTEKGEAVAQTLLKTPLKYVRISSRFDPKRLHPILHTERAHQGVDFAAPRGTPVWAVAGGKVTACARQGGEGNAVHILHPGGMETLYMHLDRFARGLEVGEQVRQKQVIGYVGSTGMATGPHLHFAVKMAGRFSDPMRLKPQRVASLVGGEREAFEKAIGARKDALAKIDARRPVREVTRGPSPAP